MSEQKHTPGPWTHQHDETFSPLGDRRIVGADCISPAIVFGGIRESDANARLIAAAPDLLHVSKEALNALLDYVPQLEAKGATMGYGNSVIRQLAAAIAKAGGRQS